jgi:PAS domain-containing protein
MMNFIRKWLDEWAVKRIKNRPEAKDLLISSQDGFDMEHGGFAKDTMVDTIGNALPDMMWAKDLEGKYIWANQKIIDGLLFSETLENTVGRKDVEMAKARIDAIGADKHTFGVVCGNSDYVVLDTEEPERFLEFGLVTGKEMYLEVHKDVLRNSEGEIIGTVGTGRDITEEYIAMREISNKLSDKNVDLEAVKEEIEKLMHKYYFEA